MKTKNYHRNLTTGQGHRRYHLALIVIAILASAAIHYADVVAANELEKSTNLRFYPAKAPPENSKNEQSKAGADEIVREVTAYNAGDPAQTDESPCISANGENVCTALELGHKRCAANFVPFGTRLHIENFGECLVVDRMNRRYKNRVDIAMNADEKLRAIKFGLQNLVVKVLR